MAESPFPRAPISNLSRYANFMNWQPDINVVSGERCPWEGEREEEEEKGGRK
jgi:hypothetical protein